MKPFNVALMVLVALLLLANSSVYQVREGYTAIVLKLGEVVRDDVKPGLHFKLPLVEDVRQFKHLIQSLASRQPERYLTSEQKDVSVDFFVMWRINDATAFYRASGSGDEQAAALRLTPIIQDTLRNDINARKLEDVVSGGRGKFTGLLTDINKRVANLGIEVIDLRIKSIELPKDSDVLLSVFERMRTERTKIANDLRSNGSRESLEIRAEADRKLRVLLADAERDAQISRGRGDAAAAQIYAAAYQDDADFYAFYRSLEAYRNAFSDGNAVLVLDKDSEFLRYFDASGRPAANP